MIGVIADDLTGAAELGGLATRLGMRAAVFLGGALEGQPGASLERESEVVCIDTDSRSCSSKEAGVRAAAAALWLKEAGATWIYKKVDSVLRGQVIPELEAILHQLGYKLAILAPANPSLGRIIRNGNYFVGEKPVHQTEFARDPAYPRTTSNVLGLLGPSKFSVCCRGPEAGLPAAGIVVAEAETSAEVASWAERCGAGVLPAGGAEFFGELVKSAECRVQSEEVPSSKFQSPKKLQASTGINAEKGFELQKELFVCGSTSESAREFVRTQNAERRMQNAERGEEKKTQNAECRMQNAERGVPSAAVFSLPAEIANGAQFEDSKVNSIAEEVVRAFREHRRVILQVGLPPVREAVLAARLALELVRVAEAVLRLVRPARVFAEGGATAVELARRMGWESLSVVRELAPGVVGLAAKGRGVSTELIIKPGSYRWPEEVVLADGHHGERGRSCESPHPAILSTFPKTK
jgi:hypothetical protein